MTHTDEKLQPHLDALTAAAMDLDFTKMAEVCIALLWTTAELRADFEELPALIEEHKNPLQRAGNDFDGVVFADHLMALTSSLAQRHGTRDIQQQITKIFADVPAAARDLDSVKIASAFVAAIKVLLNPRNIPRRLAVVLDGKTIRIGRHFSVCFRRTLRIPEDGKDYPLPPGFSRFPICKVEDYADKVPANWLEDGGFFIPMHQREALYLEFGGAAWRPAAAKIGIGKINAVTGDQWDETIRKHKQDYVIVPDQHWLDGINSDDGRVRQFVAMPLGEGYTVEEQITDESRFGGIQVVAFDPKTGVFPEEDPKVVAERKRREREREDARTLFAQSTTLQMAKPSEGILHMAKPQDHHGALLAQPTHRGEPDYYRDVLSDLEAVAQEMGIAAGGKIRQEIVEDYYGAHTWDENCRGKVYIRIVNSVMFKLITGEDAPPSPISAKEYNDAGLPWFDYYNENAPAVLPSNILAGIKPIAALDQLKGQHADNREAVHISPEQIRRIHTPSKEEQIKLLQKSALASFDGKRFELAKRLADRLLELDSADVLALRIRAECNLQFRKWIHAEQDARDCLTLDPDSAFTLRTRAQANLMLGHYAEAAKDASDSLDRHPDNTSALMIRGEAFLHLKRYPEAIADCSSVLTLNAVHDGALRIRAESYRMSGKYSEAIADATSALNLYSSSAYALSTRAESFRKAGNFFDARRDAEEALRLKPEDAFTKGILEKLPEAWRPKK